MNHCLIKIMILAILSTMILSNYPISSDTSTYPTSSEEIQTTTQLADPFGLKIDPSNEDILEKNAFVPNEIHYKI